MRRSWGKTQLIYSNGNCSWNGEQIVRCTRSNSYDSILCVCHDCARLRHSADQTRCTWVERCTSWQVLTCVDLQKRASVGGKKRSHGKQNAAGTTLDYRQFVWLISTSCKGWDVGGRYCTYSCRNSIIDYRSITIYVAWSIDTHIHVEDGTGSKPSSHGHSDQSTWRNSWKSWDLYSWSTRVFVDQIIVVDCWSSSVYCSFLKNKHIWFDL